jgi:hypothetical protein
MNNEPSDSDIEVDDLRPEYDFSEAMPNKYAERYRRGTNIVVIDDDLREDFPNTEAVNDALRELLRIRREGAA